MCWIFALTMMPPQGSLADLLVCWQFISDNGRRPSRYMKGGIGARSKQRVQYAIAVERQWIIIAERKKAPHGQSLPVLWR
jgi:hypothetical protein